MDHLILGATVGVVALTTPLLSQAVAVWRTPQRLDVALARIEEAQLKLAQTVGELRNEVRSATGEDRVIRQPPGLSYIKEPVRAGENVVLMLVVGRTKLGADCLLTRWTPLFTDERNVATPGRKAGAPEVQRQIGTDVTTMRIEMVPPQLRPGRITVVLVLDYVCDGQRVADKTDPVAYYLLAAGD
ncbi:hypothetical protein P2H44_22625 [Albimonas sp. CAU 1670]|uniref:hypothetical protein n=1 Tax=Albimonas sp. CAU 1670 TaxID=3032599 RepID=UPI0023D99E88|nr:hypothetical protein [Albimonas sp. CAU 1670]MDF2235360.1 hypothetical protein [Albimonas sp. CAU 1670]